MLTRYGGAVRITPPEVPAATLQASPYKVPRSSTWAVSDKSESTGLLKLVDPRSRQEVERENDLWVQLLHAQPMRAPPV